VKKKLLANFFLKMANLLNKFKLLWGKGFRFVTEGAPAVVGEGF
jgi:hypothetical protein